MSSNPCGRKATDEIVTNTSCQQIYDGQRPPNGTFYNYKAISTHTIPSNHFLEFSQLVARLVIVSGGSI